MVTVDVKLRFVGVGVNTNSTLCFVSTSVELIVVCSHVFGCCSRRFRNLNNKKQNVKKNISFHASFNHVLPHHTKSPQEIEFHGIIIGQPLINPKHTPISANIRRIVGQQTQIILFAGLVDRISFQLK
jgi:hypothetical protein